MRVKLRRQRNLCFHLNEVHTLLTSNLQNFSAKMATTESHAPSGRMSSLFIVIALSTGDLISGLKRPLAVEIEIPP
jgi:hypothetical protein